jgi:hypothetical protein
MTRSPSRFGAASSQLQEITTADGSELGSQLSQLVQAMATYGAANPGFDPTVATQASKAPALAKHARRSLAPLSGRLDETLLIPSCMLGTAARPGGIRAAPTRRCS